MSSHYEYSLFPHLHLNYTAYKSKLITLSHPSKPRVTNLFQYVSPHRSYPLPLIYHKKHSTNYLSQASDPFPADNTAPNHVPTSPLNLKASNPYPAHATNTNNVQNHLLHLHLLPLPPALHTHPIPCSTPIASNAPDGKRHSVEDNLEKSITNAILVGRDSVRMSRRGNLRMGMRMRMRGGRRWRWRV
jgi:hypothetical protein